MRAGDVAGTKQKLTYYLPAGEAEGLFEQPDPIRFGSRMVAIQPGAETAMRGADGLQAPGVFNGGGHLQPIPNDAGVRQEEGDFGVAEGGDGIDIEAPLGLRKAGALFKNSRPTQAGLIDFEHQALKQSGIAFHWKAVFGVVVGPMQGVADGDPAVGSLEGAGH